MPQSYELGNHDGSSSGFWILEARFIHSVHTIEQRGIGDVDLHAHNISRRHPGFQVLSKNSEAVPRIRLVAGQGGKSPLAGGGNILTRIGFSDFMTPVLSHQKLANSHTCVSFVMNMGGYHDNTAGSWSRIGVALFVHVVIQSIQQRDGQRDGR